ncbi:DUF998 domain-containing protein [Pseudoxanthomonas sp. UC19_8]|uniref:DUF998 domain-containing protein n=1 Tax=Pseudoxanthomonas sp. UC19_8 TaxID=3350175 RepID=UPI0036D41B90
MPGSAPLATAFASPSTPHGRVHLLWPGLALASLATFVAVTIVVHLLRSDLDAVRNQMSLYLIGPWGHLLQSAYCVLSVGMLALIFGLRGSLHPRARGRMPMALFVTAALALCITAYAWMDMPGAHTTVQGRIHVGAASTAFVCATVGLMWQAHDFRHDAYWRAHRRWALPWAALCFLAIWAMAWCPLPLTGLGQKSVIVLILGWLMAVSLCLVRRGRGAGTA